MVFRLSQTATAADGSSSPSAAAAGSGQMRKRICNSSPLQTLIVYCHLFSVILYNHHSYKRSNRWYSIDHRLVKPKAVPTTLTATSHASSRIRSAPYYTSHILLPSCWLQHTPQPRAGGQTLLRRRCCCRCITVAMVQDRLELSHPALVGFDGESNHPPLTQAAADAPARTTPTAAQKPIADTASNTLSISLPQQAPHPPSAAEALLTTLGAAAADLLLVRASGSFDFAVSRWRGVLSGCVCGTVDCCCFKSVSDACMAHHSPQSNTTPQPKSQNPNTNSCSMQSHRPSSASSPLLTKPPWPPRPPAPTAAASSFCSHSAATARPGRTRWRSAAARHPPLCLQRRGGAQHAQHSALPSL